MMCSLERANSRTSDTREVVRSSSETNISWVASKKPECAEGSSSPSVAPVPLMSSERRSSTKCCRRIDSESVSSLNQIIPHRETVAGVACLRLSTSRMILMLSGMSSRSPLGSVSNLLSSKTLLRFSAHSGSTSPSKTIQCLRSASPFWLARMVRSRPVKTPSVHSIVVPSRTPYRPSLSMALGSMTYISPLVPSVFSSASSKTRRAEDLPTPDGPTAITPCLISRTCFSCKIFCSHLSPGT
mmetsp:Transcript_19505/g.56125  ORF Transcript_19505/g.56125 Transcript_19505/m.56125 type:complete len:242 (+) Transcript_19505:5184-5909(+)